ncbi:MAG: CNNM domain-containing protein [Steroidobacteraceae bacterium]|nr:CNNM domain-containing protein [Steroidobacteraceae bacterium]
MGDPLPAGFGWSSGWTWAALGLAVCLLLAALFAAAETALVSVDRSRLRDRAQSGERAAERLERLLERPERVVATARFLKLLVQNGAAALVAVLAYGASGSLGAATAVALLTLAALVVCELAPKTWGALEPDHIAYPLALPFEWLQLATRPVVGSLQRASAALLRLAGVGAPARPATGARPERTPTAPGFAGDADATPDHGAPPPAPARGDAEALRDAVAEAGATVPLRHREMLLRVLDLERITVDDIMVPRGDVVGVDLHDDWDRILRVLRDTQHTRLPVYEGDLDHIVGILHMKRVARELVRGEFDRDALLALARTREPYYVPEGTTLNTQLANFQRDKRRHGFVVDEYGDVQGLVTLEDILEEIVGEFTTGTRTLFRGVRPEADGSYVIAGGTTIRALNRALGWSLPTDGPKTLNGLVLDYLEAIPEPGTSLKLEGHAVEVLQLADNAVKTLRVWPAADGERGVAARPLV